MKYTYLTILCLIVSFNFVNAQIKVTYGGNVGIGTTTPIGKLNVQGRIFLTGNSNTIRISPDNPGTEIGSNLRNITFWYSTNGYNTVIARNLITKSDSSLKQDIAHIDSCSSIISKLNGVKYHFKPFTDDETNVTTYDTSNYTYGFIAQDVEKIIPDIVSESKGTKGIDYSQIIPFVVEALKENINKIAALDSNLIQKQLLLDSLSSRISSLEQTIAVCCSTSTSNRVRSQSGINKQTIELNSENRIILNQNDPNPFLEKTKITWFIPENTENAILYFYDISGKVLRSVQIYEKGEGELLVYASDLHAGIYTYCLVVNGEVVDTKKMIKSK